MTDPLTLKPDFDLVATAVRFPALSDEQWSILVEGESEAGLEALARLTRAARDGHPKAVETFKAWHKAVRVTAQLRAHGFGPVTKREARRVMEAQDTDRVVTALHAIGEGSVGMRAQVMGWLDDVRAASPVTPAEAPTAPSPRSITSAPQPRFAAVPPPPGVHTGPVRPATEPTTSRPAPVDASRERVAPQGAQVRPLARTSGHATDRPPASPAADGRHFDQFVCYGRDTAVAFDCMPTPDRSANTILFKVARARGATCKSGLHWNDAIRFNLAPSEVLTMAAVLLGYLDKVHCGGHGHDHRKWCEIAAGEGRWAGSLRLTVAEGEDRRSVNIGANDVAGVIAIFYRAMGSQLKVDPALYPSIIQRAVECYRQQAARPDTAPRVGHG